MSYVSQVLQGVYALEWGARAEAADMPVYTKEIAAAYQAQKAKLVALVVIPADSQAPDDAARKAQAALYPELFRYTSKAIMVFEGQGFTLSLKRSVLTAIILMTRGQYPIEVRHSVEEALVTRPPPELTVDGGRVLAELRARGFTS